VSFFNFFGNIVITGHAIDSLHLNLVVNAGYVKQDGFETGCQPRGSRRQNRHLGPSIP
jgi:hypothetical protein